MSENITDRIDRFIKYVGDYLAFAKLRQEYESMLSPGDLQNVSTIVAHVHGREIDSIIRAAFDPQNASIVKSVLENDKISNEARNNLLRAGRELATELEVINHDSTPLFKFLSAADGGGGPVVAAPLWPDVKAPLLRIATRRRAGLDSESDGDVLVTLDQVAPLTGLSKRTLERYLFDGSLPPPDRKGGKGKAHKWSWSNLRPALGRACSRQLPAEFVDASRR